MAGNEAYRLIGTRLRAARRAARRTQRELANLLGVDAATYSRYETGNVQIGTLDLVKAARFLDVPVTRLLGVAMGDEAWDPFQAALPMLQGASDGGSPERDADIFTHWPQPWEREHGFAALRMRGSCMEPVVHDGDVVVVNVTVGARPGDIVAALCGGEVLVRYLHMENDRPVLRAMDDQTAIAVDSGVRIAGVARFAGRWLW